MLHEILISMHPHKHITTSSRTHTQLHTYPHLHIHTYTLIFIYRLYNPINKPHSEPEGVKIHLGDYANPAIRERVLKHPTKFVLKVLQGYIQSYILKLHDFSCMGCFYELFKNIFIQYQCLIRNISEAVCAPGSII